MKLGIIGLAYSGKTTLLQALTLAYGGDAVAPARPGERSVRVVKVPDARLDALQEVHQAKKFTPATVEFDDVPGFGGGDAYFAGLHEHDALVVVLRAFASDSVPHEAGSIDANRDRKKVLDELVLADLTVIEKRIGKLEVQITKPTPAKEKERDQEELAVLRRLKPTLDAGQPLRGVALSEREEPLIRGFQFLTLKPVLFVRNLGDTDPQPKGGGVIGDAGVREIAIRCKLEAELWQLAPDERGEFMKEMGVDELVSARVIQLSYELLERISFLTAGPKEVRAWTIRRGTRAPQAAGAVHSDIERGFIRAEVVSYEDWEKASRSMKNAKAAGRVRLEGKDYIMQDGDIVEYRFSV